MNAKNAPASRDGREILREYLLLMDALARANGRDPLWWATDAASKNRVRSPLLWLLGDGPAPAPPGLWQSLRTLAGEYRRLVRRIRQANALFPCTAPTHGDATQPVSVIKTFAYASSFGQEGFADPFFPGLAAYLRGHCEPKRRVVTICVDFDDSGEVKRRLASLGDPNLLPLEAFLTPVDAARAALRILHRILVPGFRAPAPLAFHGREVSEEITQAFRHGGGLSLGQLAHLPASEAIGRRLNVDHCVLTYEGNPWERMFVLGLRRARPGAEMVGCQHSVVPQAAAGVFPGPAEMQFCPLPDRILTTGPATARIILENSAWPKERVAAGCALRYAGLHTPGSEPAAHGPPRNVLVALEGLDEAVDLAAYAMDQARLNPQVRFTIRTHPVLPLDAFLTRLGLDLEDIPNVWRSTAAHVDQDVAGADAVLYWGTTVCLEALMRGRPVIHFDRGDRPSYDPLFEGCDMQWIVNRQRPLAEVLEEIGRLDATERATRTAKARETVRGYLHPVTPELLRLFLPAASEAKEHL